jgi:uncharacterized protein (DUF1778 family)
MVRPKKPADEVRSQVLQLRLTVGEREAMERGAEAAGEQLSEFIRRAAMERARTTEAKTER